MLKVIKASVSKVMGVSLMLKFIGAVHVFKGDGDVLRVIRICVVLKVI